MLGIEFFFLNYDRVRTTLAHAVFGIMKKMVGKEFFYDRVRTTFTRRIFVARLKNWLANFIYD